MPISVLQIFQILAALEKQRRAAANIVRNRQGARRIDSGKWDAAITLICSQARRSLYMRHTAGTNCLQLHSGVSHVVSHDRNRGREPRATRHANR